LEVGQKGLIGLGVCKVVPKELANSRASLSHERQFAALMANPVLSKYGTPLDEQGGHISIIQQGAMGFNKYIECDVRRRGVVD